MNILKSLVLLLTVSLFAATTTLAQQKRLSPHETISVKIGGKSDGNRVIVVYGRPYTKDPESGQPRTIWGGRLVPARKVWRLGADEATLLITQKDIMVGGTKVPAGSHSLFLDYQEGGAAKLVISNLVGEWGLEYDAKQDFARVDLTKAPADKETDQFTITLTKSGSEATLTLMWGDTQYTTQITNAK